MTIRWIDRAAFAIAVAFLVAAVALALIWSGPARAAATPRVQTALSRQAESMRGCLILRGHAHLTVCGANYTDVLLAVNARRELYGVAVGIHRASHTAVEACRCRAGKVLQKAQQVAPYTRRRFRDWWSNPKTAAGHKLKGCLKNAALALGAAVAVYEASGGKTWNDNDVMWATAVACGIGSIVDA